MNSLSGEVPHLGASVRSDSVPAEEVGPGGDGAAAVVSGGVPVPDRTRSTSDRNMWNSGESDLFEAALRDEVKTLKRPSVPGGLVMEV